METASHFAFLIASMGCGIDPTGGLYITDEVNDDLKSVSFDLIRRNPFVQDSILLESQLHGCYVEFIRHDILQNKIIKSNAYLTDYECDQVYLDIMEH